MLLGCYRISVAPFLLFYMISCTFVLNISLTYNNNLRKYRELTIMKRKNAIILTLTALIWGVAFVAQSEGGDAVGAYSFNCIRSFIGSFALIPAIMLLDKMGFCHKPSGREDKRNLIVGGICCGVVLFLASNLQQLGINMGAGAGKAGFLTACYIILVPILGIFLKKKCGINIWIGVALTVAGLYLLCIEGPFVLKIADILVMLCALVFAVHILVIDHFSPLVDGVRMSCIQFFVSGVLTLIPMIFVDMKPFSGGFATWSQPFAQPEAWITILYGGLLSCGVAYTLQIVGQDGANPTIASLIMSLESVFAVLAGWLLLGERLSFKALCGCGLIFAAIVIAQLPVAGRKDAS